MSLFTSNFKKLPGAFVVALAVIMTYHLLELFLLPINFFTFRVWESLNVVKYHSAIPGRFYPNMRVSMVEVGDLGHHTEFAVRKPVKWETDRYGYRKRNVNVGRFDIVIVGDSSIVGPGLTQKDILSEVLEVRLQKSVYPFARENMNTFLTSKRFNEDPPEVVILGEVERHITGLPEIQVNSSVSPAWLNRIGERYSDRYQPLAIILDRLYKKPLLRFCAARIREMEKKGFNNIRGLISGSSEKDRRETEERMLFFQGIEANRDIPDKYLDLAVRILASYDELLREKGIRFIFLPIPNKENLYYDYLPVKKKPVFLKQLTARLKARGIEVADTQHAYEKARRETGELLYHTDDSHWNAHGVKIAADMLEEILKDEPVKK